MCQNMSQLIPPVLYIVCETVLPVINNNTYSAKQWMSNVTKSYAAHLIIFSNAFQSVIKDIIPPIVAKILRYVVPDPLLIKLQFCSKRLTIAILIFP